MEETAKKVKAKGYNKVGLLATETTINNKIYNKDFDSYGISLVVPEEQDKVTEIIRNILAGKKFEADRKEAGCIIGLLKDAGAEAVILGCTDLPILLKQKDIDLEVFDTVKILAEAAVKYATSQGTD